MNTESRELEPVFPGADFCSHMPFLRRETLLFCCAGKPREYTFAHQGRVWQRVDRDPRLKERFAGVARHQTLAMRCWKLWVADWHSREARRLPTGLPDDALECVPSYYEEDGTFHVSFIGGIPRPGGIAYGLYQMSGPSLQKLSTAKMVIRGGRAGFVSSRYQCLISRRVILVRSRESGKELYLRCPQIERFQAINCCADREDTIIITGQCADQRRATLIYDLGKDETYLLRVPQRVYKPTLYGNQLICAEPRKGANDDYQLCQGSFKLEQTLVDVVERLENDSAQRSLEHLVVG